MLGFAPLATTPLSAPAATGPLVQTKTGALVVGETTLTATFNAPTTSGNLLVVFVCVVAFNDDSQTIDSVADNKGNTFTKAVGDYSADNNGFLVEIWYAENITGGASHQITVTGSDDFGGRLQCNEFAGLRTSGAHDAGAAAFNGVPVPTSSTSHSVTSGTLAQADELLVAGSIFFGDFAPMFLGTPSGFTALDVRGEGGGSGNNYETAYKVVSSTSPVTATWTHPAITVDNSRSSAIAAFKFPAVAGVDDLVALNLATGAPTVGTPAVGQVHALAATGIATGAPTVGTPAIGQRHALTATGIATGAPTVGTPAVGQRHALTATGIATGAPTVGTPLLAEAGHSLTATGISTGAPTVGTPAIGQAHALAATGVATGAPTVGTPAIGQRHALAATGVTTTPVVGTPAIGQRHVLSATGIATGAPTVGTPALQVPRALTATGIATGAPTVGTTAVGQRHALAANGVTGSPTCGAPAIGQRHALAATGCATGAPTIGVPAIGQRHALAAPAISTDAPSVGTPVLGDAADLTPTPLERIAYVGAEQRAIAVLGEPRIALVPLLKDRTAAVLAELRVAVVPLEDRTAEVPDDDRLQLAA